jgi:SulP family sulfate permease
MMQALKPKLVSVLQGGYSSDDLRKDFLAGLIVAILAIPMSIAFAIASGARPEVGLHTAIIGAILGGLTTGSRFQITGPTGAFVILITGIIAEFGMNGLIIATGMAGIILLCMGFAKFGAVIKFIPFPVTVGFTSGIALVILTTQIPELTGIQCESPFPTKTLDKCIFLGSNWHLIQPAVLGIGVLSLLLSIYWPRINKTIPGPLVVILIATLIVQLTGIPVETIGDRFGSMQSIIPKFQLPEFDLSVLPGLISPAIAIALLSGIESLLSAVVADGMTGRRHRSDMELISQGVCNLGSSLCGGLPATGAIARTATNIKSGARSPLAAIFQGLVIVLLLYFLSPYVSMIPMASLAALMVMVAYNMSEWRVFLKLFRSPPGDIVILVTTFLLTVFVDLVTAIEVGIILAAFITLNRLAQETRLEDWKTATSFEDEIKDVKELEALAIPKEVEIFEIHGALFFAAAEKFKITLNRLSQKPKVLILRMRHVMGIDATGVRALTDIIEVSKKKGTIIILSGVPQSKTDYGTLEKAGVIALVGKDRVFPEINSAVRAAKTLINT